MATLIFKNKNLQSILRHTEEATSFRATHEEAIRAYEKDTGSKYHFDKPADLSSYDKLTKPTLWLVKDSGIYLMTSAYLDRLPEDKSHVCYAVGFAPDDPDCYYKSKEAVGGDDFVESIPFNNELKKGIRNGADIHVKITPKTFTVELVYHSKP